MPIHDVNSLISRIKNHQSDLQKRAADECCDVTDPRNRGSASAPKMDGDVPAKTGLPNNSKPSNTTGTPDGVTTKTNPTGTGEDVPAPSQVKKPDEMPLDKVAARASKIASSLKAILAPAPAGAPAPKSAATVVADDVALTDEFHLKIASALMATEEGREIVRTYLVDRSGIEAAQALVKSACDMQELFQAQHARQEEIQKQASANAGLEEAAVTELLKNASAEDRETIIKVASAHRDNLSGISEPIYQLFYKQGAMDAAAMQDASMGAPEGAAPPTLPGAEEGPASLEQIASLLQMMVESGEIDAQTAQQVIAELVQGEQGGAPAGADPTGGAPGGAPGAPAGGGEMPPEAAMAPEEEEKQASALIASLIPELVRQ